MSKKSLQHRHDRMTLQEYLKTREVKKKLRERHRSRSRGKQAASFASDQESSMNNIFGIMNNFLIETKLDISEQLQQNLSKENMLAFLSGLLDNLISKIKDEIKKVYRDIYLQYSIQNDHKDDQRDHSMTYFKQRVEEAQADMKKSHMSQAFKQHYKNEQKHKDIINVILNDSLKEQEKDVEKNLQHDERKLNSASFLNGFLDVAKNDQKDKALLLEAQRKSQKVLGTPPLPCKASHHSNRQSDIRQKKII